MAGSTPSDRLARMPIHGPGPPEGDGQGSEAVRAGVVVVGPQRRRTDGVALPDPIQGDELVLDEAGEAGDEERADVLELARMQEPVDRRPTSVLTSGQIFRCDGGHAGDRDLT